MLVFMTVDVHVHNGRYEHVERSIRDDFLNGFRKQIQWFYKTKPMILQNKTNDFTMQKGCFRTKEWAKNNFILFFNLVKLVTIGVYKFLQDKCNSRLRHVLHGEIPTGCTSVRTYANVQLFYQNKHCGIVNSLCSVWF